MGALLCYPVFLKTASSRRATRAVNAPFVSSGKPWTSAMSPSSFWFVKWTSAARPSSPLSTCSVSLSRRSLVGPLSTCSVQALETLVEALVGRVDALVRLALLLVERPHGPDDLPERVGVPLQIGLDAIEAPVGALQLLLDLSEDVDHLARRRVVPVALLRRHRSASIARAAARAVDQLGPTEAMSSPTLGYTCAVDRAGSRSGRRPRAWATPAASAAQRRAREGIGGQGGPREARLSR